jgi:DNA-binding MarR family transcriptional regulator
MGLSKSEYVALAEFRSALRQFLRIADGGARAAGMTPRQHQLLLAIRGTRGRDWATAAELAESLQVRHNSVVGMIDRCAALGLVRRFASPVDRRVVEVRLTARGARALERVSSRNRRELDGLRRTLNLSALRARGSTSRSSPPGPPHRSQSGSPAR